MKRTVLDRADALPPEPQSPLLRLAGVWRSYRMGDQTVEALAGIDLTIQAGEFVAIVGQSGSGKSTLLNMLGCLDRPSAGQYRIAGQDVAALDPDDLAALRRHTFGFVFQSHNLLPRLSAQANVALPALYAGEPAGSRQARAAILLERLGLGERLRHRPAQLSGGQQQRVGIARALMNGGRVILADEPTGALDSRTSREIMALFRSLCDEGHTVVIVTHDSAVASGADRIIEIVDGRILSDQLARARGPVRELAAPRNGKGGAWLRQSLEMIGNAARAIAMHRLRSLLTMIGIVVGIASVVLAVAAGEGAQREVLASFAQLSSDVVEVRSVPIIRGASQRGTLTPADVERLAALPFISGVTPAEARSTMLQRYGRTAQVTIYGVAPAFFCIQAIPIRSGRTFTEAALTEAGLEIVIDLRIQAELFTPGEEPLGAVVLAGAVPARIVGIVQPAANSRFGGLPFSALPYTTFRQRIANAEAFQGLTLQIAETADRGIVLAAIRKLLAAWHGRRDFQLLDTAEMRAAVLRTRRTFSLLILTVASTALMIASIGVMNMMLVAVAERTREIGLLMALGARRRDVLLQFFVEGFVICVAGGALGTGLAFALGQAARAVGAPVTLVFGWETAAAAVLGASAAGITAGVLPARRAARIDPIEALTR